MNSASLAAALLSLFSLTAIPQTNGQANNRVPALTKFPFENSVPLKIVREAVPSKPFTVTGPRGAILGQQDGSFEAWIFPWKILSHMRITRGDAGLRRAHRRERAGGDNRRATRSHHHHLLPRQFHPARNPLCAAQRARWGGCAGLLSDPGSAAHDAHLQLHAGDAAHVAGTLRRPSIPRVGEDGRPADFISCI